LLIGLTLLLMSLVAGPIFAQDEPPPDLTIDQMHIFLLPTGDRLQVTEHYLLGNAGAETYHGDDDGITVHFPLPDGATDVRPGEENQETDRYRVQGEGIADTAAIPPGSATVEVRFSYELPLEIGEEIARTVPLPVQSTVLLIAGAPWALEGAQLAPFGSMEVGGQPAQAYTTVDPLAGGDGFTFAVTERDVEQAAGPGVDTSPPDSATRQANPTRDLGLGLVALAAAAVAAFMLWRTPRLPEIPDALRDDIVAIAALDEQFAAGEISEESYREARDTLKAGVVTRLRGTGVDD
jgi:hypothetical protein